MHSRSYPTTRPIGFSPLEISTRVLHRVVDMHASEAAFLWKQRDRATYAPHFALRHLSKLDARLLAHLEGLTVAGEAGWRAAQAGLGEADAGALFAAAYLAFSTQRAQLMTQVLRIAASAPSFDRPLQAALAWLDLDRLQPTLDRLSASDVPDFRRLALVTCTAHRSLALSLLSQCLRDDDPVLRARALRAIGETRQHKALSTARETLSDSVPICRFWAAWSVALLGDTTGASVALAASEELPNLQVVAINVAMRCGDPLWARDMVRWWASNPSLRRTALRAAGALGDPAAVPWLIEHFDDPAHARIAGESFSMITGADLKYLDLNRDAPSSATDDVPEDEDLPWPDTAAIREWWSKASPRFTKGHRYLTGQPVSRAGAIRTLRDGFQRQRRAAAIELVCASDASVLFPVDARADWQCGRLAL
ncbi:TIGR02270 family protein [Caballeronia novacaledonica]|uniref:TIGR02270 family protein n=1 Tax=Caballeronia novacaledonica TaxID=1544861 RepID=A0ACB5R3W0_9BURK|nr:TIGR02270 family protein [Caballeronia novacaledonica]